MIINLALYISSVSSKETTMFYFFSLSFSRFLLNILTHFILIILTIGILSLSLSLWLPPSTSLFLFVSFSLYPAQLADVDRRCVCEHFPKHAHRHIEIQTRNLTALFVNPASSPTNRNQNNPDRRISHLKVVTLLRTKLIDIEKYILDEYD
jgi:hypothetical protein